MERHNFPGARTARPGASSGELYGAPGVLGVFTRGLQQGAVAAERSQVQLRNPGGSNVLVFVEQIVAATAAAATVTMGRTGTALATSPQRGTQDGRFAAASRAIVATGTHAGGAASTITRHRIPAGESIELIGARDIRLYPGDDLTVEETAGNAALDVTFRWKELSLDSLPPSTARESGK